MAILLKMFVEKLALCLTVPFLSFIVPLNFNLKIKIFGDGF